MPVENKSPLLSKTLWVNALAAILALAWPAAGGYIAAHPEMVMVVFAVVNMVLRFATKSGLQIGD